MNLTNEIILEFSNGYFEVRNKKVAEDSGNDYLSDKKTFATLAHLQKYLEPCSVAESDLVKACQIARLEAGIKSAKVGVEMKNKIKGKSL